MFLATVPIRSSEQKTRLINGLSSPYGMPGHPGTPLANQKINKPRREANMGWMISVGTAGTKGKSGSAQGLTLCFDAEGMHARVKMYPDAAAAPAAAALPTAQAQRVWRNVLATLVGTE
jgi:hypothetical protein